MARYYHYKTVCVGSKENNICNNVCKGLDIIKIINYKLEDLMMPLRPAGVKIKKGRSFSRKRSSSYTNALLLLSKRMCLGSLPKGGKCFATLNRVYRRVITKDYGKPFYEASFWAIMFVILKGGIEGYEFSYTRAGII